MKSILALQIAAYVLVYPSVSGAAEIEKTLTAYQLRWKAENQTDIPFSPHGKEEVAEVNNDKKATVSLRRKDGSKTVKPRILDPKVFVGDTRYSSSIPSQVRGDEVFVRILLSGTVGESPDYGSWINIDGAILGFEKTKGTATNQAQVAVRQYDSNGRPCWIPVAIGVSIDRETLLTRSVSLAVRFAPDGRTWDLFLDDIIITRGLSRNFDSRNSPSVVISPGSTPDGLVLLKEFAFRGTVRKRFNSQIQSTGNEIDLPLAFTSGEKGVVKIPASGNIAAGSK